MLWKQPEVRHPPISTFYFSQRSHGGILEPTDCSFSPTLACCDTHTHTHTHKHTHALTHRGLRHSLSHRETPPLFWKYTIAIHSAKSTHTTSCLLGYTSSTHTRSLTRTLRQTNTHAHTSQRAPRLIASPFGWCHLFHTFCRWLTKSCSELVVLWGHMMEVLVLTCRRLMSWPETLLSIYL